MPTTSFPSTISPPRLTKIRIRIALGLLVAFLWVSFPGNALSASVVIDDTVNTTATSHNGTTFTNVFTSDQTGYAFYRDSTGACVYRKTTDGGTSWSTTSVTVDSQTDCIRVSLWYDRWTPGNTTGTRIHVVTVDSGSDDLWYTEVNTASDTISTTLNITSSTQGGTFSAGSNLQAVTMARNGTIYAGIQDAGDSFVIRCSSNCTASLANWTEAGPRPYDLANDVMILLPIKNNNVVTVRWDVSLDDVQSKIWNNASGTWATSWTPIDSNCAENTTYDGHFGATLNKISGDLYLAYGCQLSTIGGNDDDIRTAKFSDASSTWATTTDAITNATSGITGAKVGLDSNTGNIYVVYSARATATIATSSDVYYKVSTSTMASWGPQQGPLNSTRTDIYGLRIDGMNDERMYATWVDITADDIVGNTVADLVMTTYAQSAYKFFGNLNATSVGPAFANTNNPTTMPPAGTPFRLRLLMHVGGEGADVNRDNFKLQVATSTPGGCDTSFSGETYVDVATSTGEVRFYDNSSSSDGVALSATSSDPTHGSDTIVNQTYEEQNPFTNSVAKIFGGQDGKWDFALVDNSAPELQTYCFRVVKNDDSLLNTYTQIPEIQKDKAPTLGTITLNGGSDITLTEGTSTLVRATTTVTDENGYTDLYNVTAKVHRSGVSDACTPNDNDCYDNQFCSFISCGGNSCDVRCDVNVLYHADPTDAGTPWASENWRAALTVFDNRDATGTATSSPVELLTLLGLSVTPSIAYGNLNPGSTTDPLSPTTTVSSTGNASIDVTLYGTAMTSGTSSIPVGQQRYATTAVAFASAIALLVNPGATLDLNMPKTTASSSPATSTAFWGIEIPNPQTSGNYVGSNAFIGAVNSLPWP